MKELAGGPWEHSSHGKINRMQRSLLAAGIFFLAGLAPAQTPSFEVASIKPSKAEPDHSGVTTEKGRISMDNVTLKHCIRSAYGVPEAQILGGPKWIGEDRWEIQAKADKPAGDPELMVMLQSLLAERFKLAFHRETRTLPGFALVAGKGGLKMKPSAPDARSSTTGNSSARKASIVAVACPMSRLAQRLSQALHVPVSDLTGIDG